MQSDAFVMVVIVTMERVRDMHADGPPPLKPWWMSEFQQGLRFLRLVAISPLPEVGFQLPTLLSQV